MRSRQWSSSRRIMYMPEKQWVLRTPKHDQHSGVEVERITQTHDQWESEHKNSQMWSTQWSNSREISRIYDQRNSGHNNSQTWSTQWGNGRGSHAHVSKKNEHKISNVIHIMEHWHKISHIYDQRNSGHRTPKHYQHSGVMARDHMRIWAKIVNINLPNVIKTVEQMAYEHCKGSKPQILG